MTAAGGEIPGPERRESSKGVVLIYVLVLLALASGLVVAMVTRSDDAIDRSRLYADAAAAQALIAAGEASAVAALRRDQAQSPEIDHAGEDWGRVAQADVAVGGGRFRLQISDAQGRFNLTGLVAGGVLAQDRLRAVVAAAGVAPGLAVRIVALYAAGQRLDSLADLAPRAGAGADDLARLTPFLTVLPKATLVNLNAAPAALIAVLLANPVQARLLEARRARAGFLAAADVAGMGVILPAGVGFTSDFYRVRVTVQVGDTLQAMDSLIQQTTVPGGAAVAAVVERVAVPGQP